MNNTKEKNKKKIFILLLILLVIIVSIKGTYAWFSHSSRRINKFTSGEVKHEIVENFKSTGATVDILPGETINKDVWIHNTSNSNALLRVKITPVWIDTNGNTTPVDDKDLSLIFATDLTNNWIKGIDGYYYYNHILEPHDKTGSHPSEGSINSGNTLKCYSKQLLDAVQLNKTVTDQTKYANKVFDVVVVSETLQVNLDAAKEEWKVDSDAKVLKVITDIVTSYNANR